MISEYMKTFFALFGGREDTFAEQIIMGKQAMYRPRRHQIGEREFQSHIRGQRTFGFYLLHYNSSVSCCAIDVDIGHKTESKMVMKHGVGILDYLLELARKDAIKQCLEIMMYGIPCYLEFSGSRGYHIWIFFDEKIPAYYVWKLGQIITIKRDERITDKKFKESQYEFFPKQQALSKKQLKLGSLIKYPIGKHQSSGNYSYFVDIDTNKKIMGSLDFISKIHKNKDGKMKATVKQLEEIIDEKVDFSILKKLRKGDMDFDFIPNDSLASKYKVVPTPFYTVKVINKGKSNEKKEIVKTDKFPILENMINMIAPYPPIENYDMVMIENLPYEKWTPIHANIDKCPPCIYFCYWNSLNLPSMFDERRILLRFFSNKGFTPNQIAGFFKWHINDSEDNKHPEKLSYYVSYYYGNNKYDPVKLDGCKTMSDKGYCIINHFTENKLKEIQDYTDFYSIIKNGKKKFKNLKEELVFISEVMEEAIENKEKEKSDKDNMLEIFKEQFVMLNETVKNELTLFTNKKQFWCERLWHPLTENGIWRKFEDEIEQFTASNFTEAHNNNLKPLHESNLELSYNNADDIKYISKEEPEFVIREQTANYDEFEEINEIIYNAYNDVINDKTKRINVCDKTTRIGATFSLVINAKRFDLNSILLTPTNAIGVDTFSKVVKVSYEMYRNTLLSSPIYGGVLRDNRSMCLKRFIEFERDLPQRHNVKKGQLSISSFPFVFKSTCVSIDRNDVITICPYWSAIHVGYPKDKFGNITPVVESVIPNYYDEPICKKHSQKVNSDDICEFNEYDHICRKCEHFDVIHKFTKPVCAYATVVRHILQHEINVEILEPNEFTNELYSSSSNDKTVYVTREEVKELIEEGFIPEKCKINSLDINVDPNEVVEICDEYTGDVKEEIKTIREIELKAFDTVAMTYTKLRALYESTKNIENSDRGGRFEEMYNIVNVSKTHFHGVICDEVSRLVNQSNLQLSFYYEFVKANKKTDKVDSFSLIEALEEEIDTLVKIGRTYTLQDNNDNFTVNNILRAFNLVFQYFKANFVGIENRIIIVDEKERDLLDKGEMPERIINEIREKQKMCYLKGYKHIEVIKKGRLVRSDVYDRKNVRFVDVIKIMSVVNDTLDKIREIDENNGKNSDKNDIIIENSYWDYLHDLLIKDDEIIVINQIPKFPDMTEEEHLLLGSFNGYNKELYVICGWALVSECIFSEAMKNFGFNVDVQSLFFQMYSFLLRVAKDKNIGLINIAYMLLLSNEKEFFINSFVSSDYKIYIGLQSMPSFENIVDFVREIVVNKNHKKYTDFVFCTDATMPLVSMATLFNSPSVINASENNEIIPTKIWKLGDPKNTCDKQLVVCDTRKIVPASLYIDSIIPIKISQFSGIKKSRQKRLSNYNEYYVTKYHEMQDGSKKIAYAYNISNFLLKFRLFVFINQLVEEYGRSNIFIITANILSYRMVRSAMKDGIKLDKIFVSWLEKYYPDDYNNYLNKKWLYCSDIETYEDGTACFFFKVYSIGLDDTQDTGMFQYYRGSKTIGTESKCRIMLVITAPSSPVNSFEWLAYYYHSKNMMNKESDTINGMKISDLSKALRRTEIQSSFFQTISRVKDPYGEKPSIVFTWGISDTKNIKNKFEWSVCNNCHVNELELYNSSINSIYDKRLGIYSDGIYHANVKIDGKIKDMELCYRCINKMKANDISVSYQRLYGATKEFNGIEDYLAFKIPTPDFYVSVPFNAKVSDHFMTVENDMMMIGKKYMNGEDIPPYNILRMKEKLLRKTIEIVLKFGLSIEDVDVSFLETNCCFNLYELRFSKGNKMITIKEISTKIKEWGNERLLELNIVHSNRMRGKTNVNYYRIDNLLNESL